MRLLLICIAICMTVPAAHAKGPEHCPPGLAKKSPACMPPGQVGKGSVLDPGSYRVLDNPARYGLDPQESYAVFGDVLVRINEDTREVLNLIGAVRAILD